MEMASNLNWTKELSDDPELLKLLSLKQIDSPFSF